MKRFGRIIAAAMLCLVLACGLEAVALADGGAPAITLGAGALVKDSKVWFGTKNTSPILWRVLHVGKHDDLPVCRADGALLISNNTMEIIQFNLDIKNGWKGSNAQKSAANILAIGSPGAKRARFSPRVPRRKTTSLTEATGINIIIRASAVSCISARHR